LSIEETHMILTPAAEAYPKTVAASATLAKHTAAFKGEVRPRAAAITILGLGLTAILILSNPITRAGDTAILGIGVAIGIGIAVIGLLAFLWPRDLPSLSQITSSYQGYALGDLVSNKVRFGVSHSHAFLAARLLELRGKAGVMSTEGDSLEVGANLTAILENAQSDIEMLLQELEGIDGQAQSDLGQRYLESSFTRMKTLANRLDQMDKWHADYYSALQFETPEGRNAALALVSRDINLAIA
jgi:hypothetical protein